MDAMTDFIIYCLIVFSLSSGWLYSELPRCIREWWLDTFKNNKLQYLAICQLCCGFWFGMFVWPFYYGLCLGWKGIGYSLAAGAVSWILGAITQSNLWQKAYYEKHYDV